MTMQDKPWYRHPWVWFIIALPAIVVIASIVTVTIAYKNPPQIVETDKPSLTSPPTSGQRSDAEPRAQR